MDTATVFEVGLQLNSLSGGIFLLLSFSALHYGQYKTKISSKYCYFGSPLVLDVLVDGEKKHKGKEKTGPAQKMPDIVPLPNFLWVM